MGSANGLVAGKVAIITGATSGIGARTAALFVEEGAKVVFTGRRRAEGEKIAAEIGPDAIFFQADATSEADWIRLVEFTMEKFGRIDALFNNAGGPAPTGGIAGVPVDGFDAAMALLVRSVMLGMKHVSPHMVAQKSGSIVNNASIASHLAGYSSSLIYGAAKAAVRHLTRCVGMELAESHVRVNSVSPGAIATGIFGKALGLDDARADAKAKEMEQAFAKFQPTPRAGLPEDIAQCVLWLASDRSSFVVATDIVVDGGVIGGRNFSEHQAGLRQMKVALEA